MYPSRSTAGFLQQWQNHTGKSTCGVSEPLIWKVLRPCIGSGSIPELPFPGRARGRLNQALCVCPGPVPSPACTRPLSMPWLDQKAEVFPSQPLLSGNSCTIVGYALVALFLFASLHFCPLHLPSRPSPLIRVLPNGLSQGLLSQFFLLLVSWLDGILPAAVPAAGGEFGKHLSPWMGFGLPVPSPTCTFVLCPASPLSCSHGCVSTGCCLLSVCLSLSDGHQPQAVSSS